MATPGNGIAAILYNSSEITMKVGKGRGSLVTLTQTTHYPFDENIKIEMINKPWPENNFSFTEDAVPFVLKAKGKIIPEWKLDKYGMCDELPQSLVSVSKRNKRRN